ncbi:hypothetical protein FDECE_15867 [Fusarium decemcellulare]|nr:hypothetical protein FDECE_15867 [Fusarium decemcellulare]
MQPMDVQHRASFAFRSYLEPARTGSRQIHAVRQSSMLPLMVGIYKVEAALDLILLDALHNIYNTATLTATTTFPLSHLSVHNSTNTESTQDETPSDNLLTAQMFARTAVLSVFAALAATAFAAEPEPYSIYLYEDDLCGDQVSSVGDNVQVDCDDLENKFSVPIRSFKFEHPEINERCGFVVALSKDDNTCSDTYRYNLSGFCYSFPGNPGEDTPAIKSYAIYKTPCED